MALPDDLIGKVEDTISSTLGIDRSLIDKAAGLLGLGGDKDSGGDSDDKSSAQGGDDSGKDGGDDSGSDDSNSDDKSN